MYVCVINVKVRRIKTKVNESNKGKGKTSRIEFVVVRTIITIIIITNQCT